MPPTVRSFPISLVKHGNEKRDWQNSKKYEHPSGYCRKPASFAGGEDSTGTVRTCARPDLRVGVIISMSISITFQCDDALRILKQAPKAALALLRASATEALRTGKSKAVSLARQRYNIQAMSALKRELLSPSQVANGIYGVIKLTVARMRLDMFPHADIWPYGVAYNELQAWARAPGSGRPCIRDRFTA